MTKRILLVDDEKNFLQSLKKGLERSSEIFITDISPSVNDAVKKISANSYDLIITDVRMPKKGGVDLLLHLKKINFPGHVKVMSAHNDINDFKKINSMGIMKVITKPFDLEWFEKMIIGFFQRSSDSPLQFESIDLSSVMQIINLDRKSATLQIKLENEKGFIYFVNGEAVNARYGNRSGMDALIELLALNRGYITVHKQGENVKRNIEFPFIELMIEAMRRVDERRAGKEQKEQISEEKKNDRAGMKKVLSSLEEVNGYLGAGVFSPQGIMLEGSVNGAGISFAQSGGMVHNILNNARAVSKEGGFGKMNDVQLSTESGIILAVCSCDNGLHYHTILAIRNEGNVAIAKLKLNKAVESLREVL